MRLCFRHICPSDATKFMPQSLWHGELDISKQIRSGSQKGLTRRRWLVETGFMGTGNYLTSNLNVRGPQPRSSQENGGESDGFTSCVRWFK